MKILKQSELLKTIAEDYRKAYFYDGNFEKCYFGKAGDHQIHYNLLLNAKSIQEVNEIIGNASWTNLICSECGVDSTIVLAFETSDYDDLYLCPSCLEKANLLYLSSLYQDEVSRAKGEKV
jgi:hypothetical protein